MKRIETLGDLQDWMRKTYALVSINAQRKTVTVYVDLPGAPPKSLRVAGVSIEDAINHARSVLELEVKK